MFAACCCVFLLQSEGEAGCKLYTSNRFHIMHIGCRLRVALLAFFWLAGLTIGTMTAARISTTISFIPIIEPSIWQILFVSLLPLLLSVLAFYGSVIILFPIAFFKAISFGFSSVLLICFYGHAGWFVRLLMMFSGVFSVCIIWFLWLSQITEQKQRSLRVFVLAALAIAFVSYLDAYIIAPFVQQLIPYL